MWVQLSDLSFRYAAAAKHGHLSISDRSSSFPLLFFFLAQGASMRLTDFLDPLSTRYSVARDLNGRLLVIITKLD